MKLAIFLLAVSFGYGADAKLAYNQCAGCHGAKGQGSMMGPALLGISQKPKLKNGKPVNDSTLREVIVKGSGRMPGFPHLEGNDVSALIDHIKKLPTPKS